MFFGSKEKDLEIERLKAQVAKLESQINENDNLYDEFNDVLKRFQKGIYAVRVEGSCSNPKLNEVIENFNLGLSKNSELSDRAVESLIEYGNANFSFKVDTNGSEGKMGSIIMGMRSLGCSVSELMAILEETSEKLNDDMVQLSNASDTLAHASKDQAARLEETAAAIEEVTSTIASTAENTVKMSKYSSDVNQSASNGEKLANDTYESMDAINNEVSSIEEAITVIDQIAFQTNILSLNAAVEAATAGEAGKGFAVVAQEVRNLATRSADAAKEIKDIVESAKIKADAGKNIATNMINGYKVLNENINKQVEIISEVSSAASEQQEALEQINDAVANLDNTTQQNATAASQINSQSQNIKALSQKLVDTVGYTTYDKDAKNRISDIDMMFTINRLKLDHINFKDANFKKLGKKTTWTVATETECNLGKWILEQEANGKEFTKTSNWNEFKKYHVDVHDGVQAVINNNASNNIDEMMSVVENLDSSVLKVFNSMQQVKIENSQYIRKNTLKSKVEQVEPKSKQKQTCAINTSTLNKIEASNDEDEWASF